MENSKIKEKLLSSSKDSRLEKFGRTLTFLCIAIIVFVVGLILVFVAQKGLSTFFVDGVNPFRFLFGTHWEPGAIGPDGKPAVGALPMFAGSLIVTVLSALVATPFAIGAEIL